MFQVGVKHGNNIAVWPSYKLYDTEKSLNLSKFIVLFVKWV